MTIAKNYKFLFKQLVKRDFKQRYKRTTLGMIWSVLSPVLDFIVMKFVFSYFFGRDNEFYTTYLFTGILVNSYFHEATNSGMHSLVGNAGIISKINVPKYIFLFSKNVASLINFGLTFLVYFIFILFDGVVPTWRWIFLIYPIISLIIFNIGMGLILSAMFVFFKDTQYLYGIFTKLLSYVSAVFYYVDRFPTTVQNLLYINPIYVYITYFRTIVIDMQIPDLKLQILTIAYALIVFGLGALIYKKNNYKFIFYL